MQKIKQCLALVHQGECQLRVGFALPGATLLQLSHPRDCPFDKGYGVVFPFRQFFRLKPGHVLGKLLPAQKLDQPLAFTHQLGHQLMNGKFQDTDILWLSFPEQLIFLLEQLAEQSEAFFLPAQTFDDVPRHGRNLV